MSACTVLFEHSIGDQVKVKALSLPAHVIALTKDSDGPAYRIAFWANGARKCEWVFGWEID